MEVGREEQEVRGGDALAAAAAEEDGGREAEDGGRRVRAMRSEGGRSDEDGLGGNGGEGEVVNDECRQKVTTAAAKMADARVSMSAKSPANTKKEAFLAIIKQKIYLIIKN